MTSGGGQPLAEEARARLEPSLGADLSPVRVHHDAAADQASQAVSAKAFTVGQDIFFSGGAYQPSSTDGFHLLAHEAAHAAANLAGRGPAPSGPAGELEISQPHQAGEQAADRAVDRAVHGVHAEPTRAPATTAAPASAGWATAAATSCTSS